MGTPVATGQMTPVATGQMEEVDVEEIEVMVPRVAFDTNTEQFVSWMNAGARGGSDGCVCMYVCVYVCK